MSNTFDEAKLALIVRFQIEDIQSCDIPQEILDRVWPVGDSGDQKHLIVDFANRHGWEVAIFHGAAEFTSKDSRSIPPSLSDSGSPTRLLMIEMARAQRGRNRSSPSS